jgi:hypothetical protein
MWQDVLIGLIVLVAAAYVAWTFLSPRSRQRLLDALAARGLLVERARIYRARMNAGACGHCSSAGDERLTPRPKS